MPAAITFGLAGLLAFSVIMNVPSQSLLAIAAALALSSFACGYAARALRYINWPSLDHIHSREYAEV